MVSKRGAGISPRRGKNVRLRKGSKLREIAIRMLSPKGLTAKEAAELDLVAKTAQSLTGNIRRLEDDAGYDVRAIPLPKENDRGARVAYRIVGKNTEIGYRSFLKVTSDGT